MFLKKERCPTGKWFDNDEWIRSLTEGQEITADVPEEGRVPRPTREEHQQEGTNPDVTQKPSAFHHSRLTTNCTDVLPLVDCTTPRR